MAKSEGIEPPLTGLEAVVLPLHQDDVDWSSLIRLVLLDYEVGFRGLVMPSTIGKGYSIAKSLLLKALLVIHRELHVFIVAYFYAIAPPEIIELSSSG